MKKFAAMMVSVAVAMALSPAAAFAAPATLGAGSTTNQSGSTQVSAQAGKQVTMYLVSKAGDYSISYENGLATVINSPSATHTFGYEGKYVTSYKNTQGWHENSGYFTYGKKGRLAEVVSGGSQGVMTYKETYNYDKAGRVSKVLHDRTGDVATYSFKYNSKKRMSKKSLKASNGSVYTTAYSYDGKGNLTKVRESYSTKSCKNTYKKGRLSKRVVTESYSSWSNTKTISYKYKAVKVPKSYVSQIKKQQWALLNQPASVGVLPVNPLYF